MATAVIDIESTSIADTPAGECARLEQANRLVCQQSLWAAGAGLIPIPFLDLAGIFAVQVKLINDLSKLYGVPFSEHKAKNLIAPLLGSVGISYAAGGGVTSLMKMIPLVGTVGGMLALSVIGSAASYALGKVFIQHFEAGGTLLDFNPEAMREYFKSQFQAGVKKAQDTKKAEEPAAPSKKA